MRADVLALSGILLCLFMAAAVPGCLWIPGLSWAGAAPDPVVGQWIAGEPPQTEFHMIFFENGTSLYAAYYLSRGGQVEPGNWTKTGPGQYTVRSRTGNTTLWIYDSSADSVHNNALPLLRYSRYKG